MDAARFERLSELFEAARELEPAARSSLLDRECGQDVSLREELRALLEQHDSQSPLDGITPGHAARTLAVEIDDIPESIGGYRIVRELGRGGMGVVYEAEQRDPKRRVALKIIKLGMDTREVIARFETERHALARMDHPGIARVYGADATEAGRPFFVMELVDGAPITRACDDRAVSIDERLRLFVRVCQAIQHAHQKGIIHRDIKPSNVLVTDVDSLLTPKVIDFGVAKATEAQLDAHSLATLQGQVIGTPAYMSPEQANLSSVDIDTRSDIYSLGVLLYELLTGTTPFESTDLQSKGFSEMMRVIRESIPSKPSTHYSHEDSASRAFAEKRGTETAKLRTMLRRDLDWVVMKCLEKDPGDRYESAGELASEIERVLANQPVLAGPRHTSVRFRKFIRRNKGRVAAVALVMITLLLGVLGTTTGLVLAVGERDRARGLASAEAEAREAAQTSAKLAQNEAETAEAIIAFLLDDLLGAANPAVSENRNLTVREAVMTASESIDEQFAGRPEVETRVRDTVGRVLTQLGEYSAAEPHIREELRLTEELHGKDSYITALAMQGIVTNLMQQSRYEDAIQLAHDQLQRLDHTSHELKEELRLSVLGNIGAGHLQLGQYAEAAPILEQTLEAKRDLLGDKHQSTLNSIHNLSGLYGSLGKHERSLELAEAAYRGRLEVLGPGDPRTFRSLNLVSWVLSNMERFEELDVLLTRALEDAETRLGPTHETTIQLTQTRGLQFFKQQDYERAEAIYRDLLEVQLEQDPGYETIDTLMTTQALAKSLLGLGKFAEASELMKGAISPARRLYPENSAALAVILRIAGEVCTQSNEFELAESLLLESHKILTESGLQDPRDAELAAENLASLYRRWHEASPGHGYEAESARWREKALAPIE